MGKTRLTLEELYAKYGEDGELQFGRYSEKDRTLIIHPLQKGRELSLGHIGGRRVPVETGDS